MQESHDGHERELNPSEVRAIQLSALQAFHHLCARLGLRYYLGWGTLLGAVRHGGFIPWDDDVDLMMPRKDYTRLLRTFAGLDEAAKFALLSSCSDKRYPYPYAKFSDRSTKVLEQKNHQADLGVNLDIFPLDAVPSTRLLAAAQRVTLRGLRALLNVATVGDRGDRGFARRVVIHLVRSATRTRNRARLIRLISAVAVAGRFRVGDRAGVRVGPFDWSVDERALGEPSQIDFEGALFNAPADPSRVLTAIYGDFMTPPPVEQQVSHHSFRAHRIVARSES